MSTGTIDATSVDFDGRVLIEATGGPNNLEFTGNGGDVTLQGIEYLLFDGAINTGTNALGGHSMSFVGERATSAAAGVGYSVGAGFSSLTLGPVPPAAGRVTSLYWSGNTASTCTIEVIGSVSGSLISLGIVAASSGDTTGNTSFVADEKLVCQVTAGTATNISRVFWTIIFD
jgi:hypothetical protein